MSRRTLIIASISAGAVVVLGIAALAFLFIKGDADARSGYDNAAAALTSAQSALATAHTDLTTAKQNAVLTAQKATDLAWQADAALLADTATLATLQQAAAALTTAAAEPDPIDSAALTPVATPTDRDGYATAAKELQAQVALVETDTAAVTAAMTALTTAVDGVDAATAAVATAAHTFGTTVTPRDRASADTVSAFTAAVAALEAPAEGSDLTALIIAYRNAWYATLSSDAAARGGEESPEATYMRGVLVVNKTFGIPASFGGGLTAETSDSFAAMKAAAGEQGLNIYIASGYRSYSSQTSIYNRYVTNEGVDGADRHSARPGHSEHQSGLAFDLNSIQESFGRTPEGVWVAENAHLYGFIVRYPEGKESITGYVWEPWHLRYVGVPVATELYTSGLTLEEWLGVESKYY